MGKKTIFSVALFLFTLGCLSQTELVVGTYFKKMGNEKHNIEYTLKLNSDQTFSFHSYSNNVSGLPQIVNKYGKGTWTIKDKIITLSTDQMDDYDDKNTLDFTNSKARFISKSPRDKSDREIPNSLQFYESDIFWIKSLQITKK
ncbi:MAG: hypothetical protein BM564_03390 [Bacteroidetes bacterium MedPE-SWsnd-G2]|nr:MAG: hypothetical protein BM564_03390 [Bacteroidetes bacterium MedPE-SWsnd-G2]